MIEFKLKCLCDKNCPVYEKLSELDEIGGAFLLNFCFNCRYFRVEIRREKLVENGEKEGKGLH